MTEERTINLDKVHMVLEKIDAELLEGVNAEFEKLFANIGVELKWVEKSYILAQLTVVGTIGGQYEPGIGLWERKRAIPAS